MRSVIQRVSSANVAVDSKVVGKIEKGFVVLLGVSDEDTEDTVRKMVKKIINLRIFKDENDKMNLSVKDINADLLVISQFTLYADCSSGNRPSFTFARKTRTCK